MTHIRRQMRNGKIYLYEARTFRDRDTGKVKQEVKYLGREVEKKGEKVLQPPRGQVFREKGVGLCWIRDVLYCSGRGLPLPV